METGTMPLAANQSLEDPLSCLPCSTLLDFRTKEAIFSQGQPALSLYLVISGKVKVYRTSETGGHQVLMDIYQADEFFGLSAFIGKPHYESAFAMENTQLMSWTTDEIEGIAATRPQLAMAFIKLVVQRCHESESRVESFAVDSIQSRLARALVRFSERFGHELEDDTIEIMALPHELIAQYLGTSREIVTHFMIRFRRLGYLRYSRREVIVDAHRLRNWLNAHATTGMSPQELACESVKQETANDRRRLDQKKVRTANA